MNSSSSFGPMTRLRSGSGPFTSCVAGALALMAYPFEMWMSHMVA